ncbi:hypothetical protein ACFQWB_09775 [Paenibacillus thermoaerophilus]|uniref:Uncharacterized protein n=1 Tax=Paenibacillus thermoaerophilus TaxID=1215385 RepID=A0ABW2V634_9BACL|nr:hypothetical protein [Paenibacillus thermoaerophilus]TMV11134.1 hypothetical protein FE781_12705 [Paenibacillus thermoaerophilus]
MWHRIASITVFFVLLAGAFVFFQVEKRSAVSAQNHTPGESELKRQLEQQYDEWWKNKEDVVESRLTYQTKIAVVHVGEINTDLLYGRRVGDLGERLATFNPETKSMYYYSEDHIPQKDDNLVVVQDIHSLDVLVKENIYRTKDQARIGFTPFEQPDSDSEAPDYFFVNEARLFNGQTMIASLLNDNGDIQVEFDQQVKRLAPGEKAVFEKSAEKDRLKIRSKVVVTNYGMWDSVNMKYVVNR